MMTVLFTVWAMGAVFFAFLFDVEEIREESMELLASRLGTEFVLRNQKKLLAVIAFGYVLSVLIWPTLVISSILEYIRGKRET